MDLDRKWLRQADWLLVTVCLLLTAFGVVAIYSATHNLHEAGDDPLYFVKRQLAWGLVGWAAALFVLIVDYRDLLRFSRLIYGAVLLLLAAALWMGPVIGGAERWLVLGPLRLQPSEFAKLGLIVVLAHYLSGREEGIGWREILVALLITAPPLALILRQPDLGTGMVLAGIVLGMLYAAGAPVPALLILMGLGLGVMGAAIGLSYYGIVPILKEYQLQRFLVFLDPYRYQHAAGWNVIQSMIAIGSGRFFGKGLFGGSQTQLNFLPARHTDFIFSVVGEEFGFLGAVGLLVLYFIMIWRMTRIMVRAKDRFGALMVSGLICLFGLHLTVNLGMAVGLMPVTGLPLPFISYGGSSLISSLLAVGLALNIAVRRRKIQF